MVVPAVPIKKKLGCLDRNERKALTLMGDAQIAFELYAMFKRADEGKTGKVRHEVRALCHCHPCPCQRAPHRSPTANSFAGGGDDTGAAAACAVCTAVSRRGRASFAFSRRLSLSDGLAGVCVTHWLVQLLEEELIKDGRFANKVMRVSKLRELRSYGHSELTLREFMRMLLPHATTTTIERYVSNSKHLMAERAKGADVHSDLYETIRRKGRCGTSVDLPEKMELLRMFALYDEDKNKLLDRDEFVECVKPMYERTLAVELFEIVDVDKSGSINPWEFLAFFTLAGDIIDENDYCMYLLGSLDKTYHDDGSKLSELLSEEDKVSGPAA
jgi:hypothetical protein